MVKRARKLNHRCGRRYLLELPHALLQLIFSLFSVQTAASASRCCKTFARLTYRPQTLTLPTYHRLILSCPKLFARTDISRVTKMNFDTTTYFYDIGLTHILTRLPNIRMLCLDSDLFTLSSHSSLSNFTVPPLTQLEELCLNGHRGQEVVLWTLRAMCTDPTKLKRLKIGMVAFTRELHQLLSTFKSLTHLRLELGRSEVSYTTNEPIFSQVLEFADVWSYSVNLPAVFCQAKSLMLDTPNMSADFTLPACVEELSLGDDCSVTGLKAASACSLKKLFLINDQHSNSTFLAEISRHSTTLIEIGLPMIWFYEQREFFSRVCALLPNVEIFHYFHDKDDRQCKAKEKENDMFRINQMFPKLKRVVVSQYCSKKCCFYRSNRFHARVVVADSNPSPWSLLRM